MFRWSLFFFVFALVAAVLGFGGVAGTAAEFAKICFYIGLVLFLVSLAYSLVTGKGRPTDAP